MCITSSTLQLPQRRLVREHPRQLLVSLRPGIQRQPVSKRCTTTLASRAHFVNFYFRCTSDDSQLMAKRKEPQLSHIFETEVFSTFKCLKSRINRLKRDYHGGARNLNEYWDAMMHIVRSVYTCNYAKL